MNVIFNIKKFLTHFMIILPLFVLLSCESLVSSYSTGKSWYIPEQDSAAGGERASIALVGVSVDRGGGWDSVEREVEALAPLFFWEHGCRIAGHGEAADYAAEISLREREYSAGWQTRRSLAVEVRIWKFSDSAKEDSAVFSRTLPLAAGRIVSIGERSFSSSGTTEKMLAAAIRKTMKKFRVKQGKKA